MTASTDKITASGKNKSSNGLSETIDENTGVMIYGHIKIIDIDTGEILVNKRT